MPWSHTVLALTPARADCPLKIVHGGCELFDPFPRRPGRIIRAFFYVSNTLHFGEGKNRCEAVTVVLRRGEFVCQLWSAV